MSKTRGIFPAALPGIVVFVEVEKLSCYAPGQVGAWQNAVTTDVEAAEEKKILAINAAAGAGGEDRGHFQAQRTGDAVLSLHVGAELGLVRIRESEDGGQRDEKKNDEFHGGGLVGVAGGVVSVGLGGVSEVVVVAAGSVAAPARFH